MRFDPDPDHPNPSGMQAIDILLNEVWAHAEEAEALLQGLKDEFEENRPVAAGLMISDYRPPLRATRALECCATLSRCIFPLEQPNRSNTKERAFHAERGRRMRAVFDGIDLDALRSREVRDSVAHVDEHLDRLMARRSDTPPRSPIIYNISLGSRADIQGANIVYLRAIFMDEFVFSNLGREVSLGPLLEVARAIRERLAPRAMDGSVFLI